MTHTCRAITVALILSCLPAVATARPGDGPRQAVSVHIPTAGFDLATPAGRLVLASRVRRAADRACPTHEIGIGRQADGRRCVREMESDAARQIAALTPRGDAQLASVTR